MILLDGRSMAAEIGRAVGDEVALLRAAGTVPTLAVVVPTDDGAARSYVRMIARTAEKTGVRCDVHELAGPDPDARLGPLLDRLAADAGVHGIMVQTPLPAGLAAADVGARIPVAKDVDGMNPSSLGRLALGLPCFAPATALAVVEILHRADVKLAGARAVVLGRGPVVGKPAALLLLAENATVTICHSHTVDLPTITHEADVLVVAVGRPAMVGAGHVKPGAVVIDVGTNVTPAGLVGDVDAAAVGPVAAALTPVPGGVGPVTTMLLLRNTVMAAAAGATW